MKANFIRRWPVRYLFIYALGVGLIGFLASLGGTQYETSLYLLPMIFGQWLLIYTRRLDEREVDLWMAAMGVAFIFVFSILVSLIGVLEILRWVGARDDVTDFLNGHWLGMVISLMLFCVGGAGLWVFQHEE